MKSIWGVMSSKENAAYYHLEKELKSRVAKNRFIVRNEDLIWYMNEMKELKMDNHLMICGNNGSGKSFTAEIIAQDAAKMSQMPIETIFRDISPYELGAKLCKSEGKAFVIDELRKYLYYMNWNSRAQKSLMDAIEVSRENRNIVIGCTKEPHRIDGSYKDGKVHTVIMLLDRGKDRPPFGFVLHAYVYLAQVDKFRMEQFAYARSLRHILEIAEDNDMFLGYYFAEPVNFDVGKYTKNKKDAIKRLAEYLESQDKESSEGRPVSWQEILGEKAEEK